MINSQRHTVSESTAMLLVLVSHQYSWDYRHEHERRK